MSGAMFCGKPIFFFSSLVFYFFTPFFSRSMQTFKWLKMQRVLFSAHWRRRKKTQQIQFHLQIWCSSANFICYGNRWYFEIEFIVSISMEASVLIAKCQMKKTVCRNEFERKFSRNDCDMCALKHLYNCHWIDINLLMNNSMKYDCTCIDDYNQFILSNSKYTWNCFNDWTSERVCSWQWWLAVVRLNISASSSLLRFGLTFDRCYDNSHQSFKIGTR